MLKTETSETENFKIVTSAIYTTGIQLKQERLCYKGLDLMKITLKGNNFLTGELLIVLDFLIKKLYLVGAHFESSMSIQISISF